MFREGCLPFMEICFWGGEIFDTWRSLLIRYTMVFGGVDGFREMWRSWLKRRYPGHTMASLTGSPQSQMVNVFEGRSIYTRLIVVKDSF